jgi:ferric-dicitrate binding protein FerR (iron transport regulator)
METADVQSAARTMPKPPELARLAVDSIRQFVATRDREQAEREAIRDREHAARYRDALRMIESMNEALQLSSAREERADKRADLAEKRQRWALAIAATSLVVTVVSFLSLIA